jgi:small multidrug resistance pump
MRYWYLFLAIGVEVIATSFLKSSNGFTKPGPTAIVIVGYGIAFYLLTLTLREMPTGVVYAIWSGCGIVLITAVAWLFQGQKIDTPALIGIAFIVLGVVFMNLFSKTMSH